MIAMRCRSLLVPVLLLPLSSCIVVAAAAVGAATFGAISWNENEAQMDFQRDFDATWQATKAALRELAFPVDDTQLPGKTEGTLHAGDATATVEMHPGNTTRVRVRVGTFESDDNKRRAQLILESLKKRLAA